MESTSRALRSEGGAPLLLTKALEGARHLLPHSWPADLLAAQQGTKAQLRCLPAAACRLDVTEQVAHEKQSPSPEGSARLTSHGLPRPALWSSFPFSFTFLESSDLDLEWLR